MASYLNITLLSLVGLVIVASEFWRYLRCTENRFDALFFAMLWFFTIYVFTPICVELAPDINDRLLNRSYAYAMDTSLSIGFIAAITLGWLCILLGHHIGRNMTRTRAIIHSHFQDITLIKHAKTLFLSALFFVALFIMAYGRLVLTTSIRMGELELHQMGSFFRHMATLSVFAIYIMYILVLRKSKFRYNHIIWLVPILIVATYVTLQSGGRGGMIMPFLVCFLLFCNHKKRIVINQRIFILFGIIIFFLLFGRFVVTRYIFSDNPGEMIHELQSRTAELAPIETGKEVLSNFTYVYISVNEAFEATRKGEVQYRYFKDIPLGILFYARLLGINTDSSVTYYNTYQITGQFRSTIPPSLIGLGIYSLGWAGIAIACFLYGGLIGFINKLFYGTPSTSPFAVYKIMTGMLIGGFVANGDPRVLAFKVLPLITCLIILKIQLVPHYNYRQRNSKTYRAPRQSRPLGLQTLQPPTVRKINNN